MDYMRKIGKSDKPKKWVRVPLTWGLVHDGLISPDVHFVEDPRLENWKQWLERRKKQHRHTKSVTGRRETDQIMYSCETVRPQIEMRNLIDYASAPVPVLPDKYRGGPEFWRVPVRLSNHGDSCLPDITVTPNKKELNVAPQLTYVGLPKSIEKEKGLVGLKSKMPLWKRSEYLMRRRNELSREIQVLVPKEPEMKYLSINNYVRPKPVHQPRIPPITVSCPEEEEQEQEEEGEHVACCSCYPEQVAKLRIQDREIGWVSFAPKCEQPEPDPIVFDLTYCGKINTKIGKEIVFENKGNRVIIYEWRRTVFHKEAIPVPVRISPFYFNKMKEVILPGQIVKLTIWYRPRRASVVTEFWRLVTDPVLCPSQLIFRLWGYAETRNARKLKRDPVKLIDGYLDRCVADTVVREIIIDIMERVASSKLREPAYGSLFLISDLFVLKNPLCHYVPTLTMELQKIFRSATDETEERWNMCLMDLREILLDVQPPEFRDMLLSRYVQLYKECLKPTLYSPPGYSKHEMVYDVLCSFFNLFEEESEFAMGACLVKDHKNSSGTTSEEATSWTTLISASQVSVKSNRSRNKRGKKSNTSLQQNQVQRISERPVSVSKESPYREIFFIRIYKSLGETMLRVFATIESFNNLNERDK